MKLGRCFLFQMSTLLDCLFCQSAIDLCRFSETPLCICMCNNTRLTRIGSNCNLPKWFLHLKCGTNCEREVPRLIFNFHEILPAAAILSWKFCLKSKFLFYFMLTLFLVIRNGLENQDELPKDQTKSGNVSNRFRITNVSFFLLRKKKREQSLGLDR